MVPLFRVSLHTGTSFRWFTAEAAISLGNIAVEAFLIACHCLKLFSVHTGVLFDSIPVFFLLGIMNREIFWTASFSILIQWASHFSCCRSTKTTIDWHPVFRRRSSFEYTNAIESDFTVLFHLSQFHPSNTPVFFVIFQIKLLDEYFKISFHSNNLVRCEKRAEVAWQRICHTQHTYMFFSSKL